MHSTLRLAMLAVLAWGGARQVWAQDAAPAPLSFDQTSGFGKAELVTVTGEKHSLYIPLNAQGFGDVLPFFRSEEDIVRPGAQPLFISVDDVQTIYVTVTGAYLEHMVVAGRRRHVLGARVVEGPVELFSYTEANPGLADLTGAMQSPRQNSLRRHWYLRRNGELVEITRGGYTKQLVAYFQDDPVLVASLADKRFEYGDMKLVVRLYNEHHSAAPAR